MSIEERVKALEYEVKCNSDLLQALGRCFIAPPITQTPPKPTADQSEVCPECGGKKKPDFKVCFKCYQKAHPKAT